MSAQPPSVVQPTGQNDLTATVDVLLAKRYKSQLFRRACCISEKCAQFFVGALIVGVMALYAYLQVLTIYLAFINPRISTQPFILPALSLPGVLMCFPANNLSLSWWKTPDPTFLYGDSRVQINPFVDLSSPKYPGTPTLIDCCVTDAQDFFTSCWTDAAVCPVSVKWVRYQYGTYGSWNLAWDCMTVFPGLLFYRDSQSVWLPYYTTVDPGILATTKNGSISTSPFYNQDDGYLTFCDNYMYWPRKTFVISFEPFENQTYGLNPTDYFLGKHDAALGGTQARIRSDAGLGLASCLVTKFGKYDVSGKRDASNSGWRSVYDQHVAPIPWIYASSPWYPLTPARLRMNSLSWMRLRISTTETRTVATVLYTYLDLITAFLSIVGASTALKTVVIGPGEYNPNGLINTLFYRDVPTLKATATTARLNKSALAAKKKGKQDDGGGDDDDDDE